MSTMLMVDLSLGEVLLGKAQRSLSISRHFFPETVSSQGGTDELSELEEMKRELHFWGGGCGGEQASPVKDSARLVVGFEASSPTAGCLLPAAAIEEMATAPPPPPLPCLPVSL